MTHTLKDRIEAHLADPTGLEDLFRNARATGQQDEFREALRLSRRDQPDSLLLEAWARRLDIDPALPESQVHQEQEALPYRRWGTIIGASVLLGVFTALLARGKPPVPFPEDGNFLFWVGWAPLVALGLLTFLAYSEPTRHNLPRYAMAAGALVLMALYVGLTTPVEEVDLSILSAFHLPLLSWSVVGAALSFSYPDPARQAFGYMVKSVETLLTGMILFAAGVLFMLLTFGIFSVLGIELPEEDLVVLIAWAVGAIPLLALGSVYEVRLPPAAQDWSSGLTRTIRFVAYILLPLALGVLLVYVLWFIPVYFWMAFDEREVLIVYNATILAILVLLTVLVSGPIDARSARLEALFRYGVVALGLLTLILNVYALAAISSRTLEAGLTPNRLAVIGWNVTTLLVLTTVAFRVYSQRHEPWLGVMREAIGRFAPLAAVWALLLLLVLPWL